MRGNFEGLVLGAILAASASVLSGTAAQATGFGDDSSDGWDFYGSATVTSDYRYHGFSASGGDPAVQGGVGVSHGAFYFGAWASTTDYDYIDPGLNADWELDLYAGFEKQYNSIIVDASITYTMYPGADDGNPCLCTSGELDYWEFMLSLKRQFGDFTAGVNVFFSPDYFLEVGHNWVFELTGEKILAHWGWTSPRAVGSVGWNEGDEDRFGLDYGFYSIGLALPFAQFLEARIEWVDTFDLNENLIGSAGTCKDICDGTVVFSLKAEF